MAPVTVDLGDTDTESYLCLTSYNIHARTSSGVGVVSTLTPMMLYVTLPVTMKNSTISVYSVADSVPNTYIRLSPRIIMTTSTQATIVVHLTELSVKTGAILYKVDVHVQGVSQSTEWFRTCTKLDQVRYPHFYAAIALASLSEATGE